MAEQLVNASKGLQHADDSAAELLVELLQGTTGRNFDVESLFVERLPSGEWRWVVYEFLKAEKIPPMNGHPNFYWNGKTGNKRKFLSLWALVQTLRHAGFQADLILVSYADDRALAVKEMRVVSIDDKPTKVFREERELDGVVKPRIMQYATTEDSVMSFEAWKKKFRDFNDNKKGDTWEILDVLKTMKPSEPARPEEQAEQDYVGLAKKIIALVAEHIAKPT